MSLAPFNKKAREYYKKTQTHWLNVAEGGVRAGKNVLNIMAFCHAIEKNPARLHMVMATSVANARQLIVDCDGYGIIYHFAGRCREGQWKGRSALYVTTAYGEEKIILIYGGNNIRAKRQLQGATFGCVYCSEANQIERETLKETFNRTMSAKNPKHFHDLNPEAESHWYYEEILNIHAEKQAQNPDYGFNYGHFTIHDNFSVSDEELSRELDKVRPGTVWYDRYILGLRRRAQGRVYPDWDTDLNGNKNIVPTVPRTYTRYIASCDYGTQNSFVMLLWGYATDKTWYCIKEYVHSGRKTQIQMNSEMYRREVNTFLDGYNVERIIIDPSAADFRIAMSNGGKYATSLADNAVSEGIRAVADAFYLGLVKINDCCKELIAGIERYVWNDRLDINGKEQPLKEADDEVDGLRYFIFTMNATAQHRRKAPYG